MNIFLVVNGPGEILGWAKPLFSRLIEIYPESNINILILPCMFSTGRELEIIKENFKYRQLKNIFDIKQSLKFIFFKDLKNYKNEKGVIIHLGGDILYSALLKRRLKNYILYGYLWGNKIWDKYFNTYFVENEKEKNELIKRGIKDEKIQIIGNLIISKIYNEIKNLENIKVKENLISFLPGSREKEFIYMLNFYLKTINYLHKKNKNLKYNIIQSPFIKIPDIKKLENIKIYEKENKIIYKDIEINLINNNRFKAIKESKLIITIPGTKTGEVGALQKAMYVITPLNKIEEIPYIGIIGWLDWLPFIGKKLKKILLTSIAKKYKFTSQPNIIANKYIVPEKMGILHPDEIAKDILNILNNKSYIKEIEDNLKEIYKYKENPINNIIKKIKVDLNENFNI